ncbi:MAG: GtrA family protein [Clostridia bacterium]|nr:GtrA family protein [Clostridia bacterium]
MEAGNIICFDSLSAVELPESDYVILYDADSDISPEELSEISESMSERSGVCAVTSGHGRLLKFFYTIAAGRPVPATCGAVGMARELAEQLSMTKKPNAVSAMMWAANRGLKLNSVKVEKKDSTLKVRFRRVLRLLVSSQTLKYALSSFSCFLFDYVLTLTFSVLLRSVSPDLYREIAVLISWVISSGTNFFINRRFVFHARNNLAKALGEYYGLATVMFIIKNYGALEFFMRVLNINIAIAKPICELAFFIVNFFIQKKIIFRKRKETKIIKDKD